MFNDSMKTQLMEIRAAIATRPSPTPHHKPAYDARNPQRSVPQANAGPKDAHTRRVPSASQYYLPPETQYKKD